MGCHALTVVRRSSYVCVRARARVCVCLCCRNMWGARYSPSIHAGMWWLWFTWQFVHTVRARRTLQSNILSVVHSITRGSGTQPLQDTAHARVLACVRVCP